MPFCLFPTKSTHNWKKPIPARQHEIHEILHFLVKAFRGFSQSLVSAPDLMVDCLTDLLHEEPPSPSGTHKGNQNASCSAFNPAGQY